MANILIIEDETDLARALRDNLEFEDHKVWCAENGATGLEIAQSQPIDLLLLDIMLPDFDGFEVCHQLRSANFAGPIIILSARGHEVDKVRGLELGADDYVTKPFGLRELLARIDAVLRRITQENATGADHCFSIGDFRIDLAHQAMIKPSGEVAPLGYYETEILRLLYENAGQAVSRQRLLTEIWGVDASPADRTIDNHIVSIRRKVEADPKHPEHILTAHAVGYKLVL